MAKIELSLAIEIPDGYEFEAFREANPDEPHTVGDGYVVRSKDKTFTPVFILRKKFDPAKWEGWKYIHPRIKCVGLSANPSQERLTACTGDMQPADGGWMESPLSMFVHIYQAAFPVPFPRFARWQDSLMRNPNWKPSE